jgi:hypothetical protein
LTVAYVGAYRDHGSVGDNAVTGADGVTQLSSSPASVALLITDNMSLGW